MWYELPGLSKINSDQDTTKDCLVLDLGHGGSDPGCYFYDGTYEKDYVLKFGLMVYKLLSPFFAKIVLTRSTDKTTTLSARAKIMSTLAEKYNSVQVYSIHCNAFNSVANGAEWLLSVSTSKTHSDYLFCTQFLADYCNTFNLTNRGIVQKESTKYPGRDYYYLHLNTPKNCKVKYIELFFGDNRNDCKQGQTETFINKAVFFLASYILKRYGLKIAIPIVTPDLLYLVQAGAFSELSNAENLVKSLNSKGFDAIIKTQTK